MAGINFIGSYSGIDQSMIDQLMEAERLPLNQLSSKKTGITAKQNAWKDVNTRLNSLYEKLKGLQSNDTFTSRTATSSNDNIVNVTASKDAVAGKYKISVGNLATSTRIIGGQLGSAEEPFDINESLGIANGSKFTIKNAAYNDENPEENIAIIEINSTDSLKDIVNKINDKTKNTGINATIIDGQLVLTDEETGARGITLENTENDPLGKLGLSAETINNGTKANFNINGISVESDSNTVKDVVLGLTINLNKAHGMGESDTITVSMDTAKLTKAVEDFVSQYNSTMSFIEDQLAAGTVTDSGTTGRGALAGDSSLQSLHASLRRMLTDALSGNTGTTIKDISMLGVSTTDKSGTLSFDSSKLLEEFSKDPQNVMNFFSHVKKDVDGKDVNVGLVSKLNTKINTYISSSDGLIKSKNESLDRALKDLNKQIDRFNERMVRKEEYYTKMFSALDVAMMEAESQMSWLSGQIDAMNVSRK